jgi:hypothetical protein
MPLRMPLRTLVSCADCGRDSWADGKSLCGVIAGAWRKRPDLTRYAAVAAPWIGVNALVLVSAT